MAATTGALPRKAHGLMTRDLGTEVVVVDSSTDQAHALTGLSADIWRSLDECRLPAASQAELASAIQELTDLGLVELPPGMSRRALLQRAGTVAIAGGVITIVMPEVMAAASGTAATTTTLAALGTGGTTSLTATISSGTPGVPTGTVSFYDRTGVVGTGNGTLLGTSPVTGNTATFTATGLPTGTRNFRAIYSGDATYAGSQGDASSLSGQPVGVTPTLTLAYDAQKNKAVTQTITVSGPTGSPATPTGTITITAKNGAATLYGPTTLPLVAGKASFSYTNPDTPATVTVTASYSGDSIYTSANNKSASYPVASNGTGSKTMT